MIKIYFRISGYAVTSTPRSVIYFGGFNEDEWMSFDRALEYRNLKWTQLGNLASPRSRHQSIKMENKIYLFGGWYKT